MSRKNGQNQAEENEMFSNVEGMVCLVTIILVMDNEITDTDLV